MLTMLSQRIAQIGGVLGATILMMVPVAAIANNAFIATVSVDGLASTDAGVRDAAILEAEADGLGAVLQRLTAERDHGRLPPAAGPNVAGYIQDATIIGTDGRIRVETRADAVRQLLTNLGIVFTETESPRLVVVPVYRGADGPALWSGNNPWLDAWQVYGGDTGLVPVAVPFGEFGDLDALSTQEALDGNPAALRALALRYEAAGTLVAVYEQRGGEARITVTVNADGGWQATESLTIGDADPMLASTVDAAVTAVGRLWVESQLRPSYDGPVSTVEVTAWFSNLTEWVGIRRALDNAAIVEGYTVPVLGGQNARLVLRHYADFGTFQQDLAGSGLVFERGGYGQSGLPELTLRLAGAAPPTAQTGYQPQTGYQVQGYQPQGYQPQTGYQAPAPVSNGIGTPLSQGQTGWDNAASPQTLSIQPTIPTLRFEP